MCLRSNLTFFYSKHPTKICKDVFRTDDLNIISVAVVSYPDKKEEMVYCHLQFQVSKIAGSSWWWEPDTASDITATVKNREK